MSSTAAKQAQDSPQSRFEITFPGNSGDLDQHEEWFEFTHEGGRKKLRIHDYEALFSLEGLYEELVYESLDCNSPAELAAVFTSALKDREETFSQLRILDLGAGNGMVAEELVAAGARYCVGVDLLEEARQAAERDRPGVYQDYLVTDLCNIEERDLRKLDDHQLNCLVTVAALGFGDIPPKAFATAFNALTWEGWLGMTIKEDFLTADDPSGFATMMQSMMDQNIIDVRATRRYQHRKSVAGDPIYYVALVAQKRKDIPVELLERLSD